APERIRGDIRSYPLLQPCPSRGSLADRERDHSEHHRRRAEPSAERVALGEEPRAEERADEDPDLSRRGYVRDRTHRERGEREDVGQAAQQPERGDVARSSTPRR